MMDSDRMQSQVGEPVEAALERMKRAFDERKARGEVKSPQQNAKSPRNGRARIKQVSDVPMVNRHPSEPPERDVFSEDQAKQFAAAPERVKETVLDSAAQVSALESLLRSKPGQWFYNHDITTALSISHVNNVASKLRAKLDEDQSGEDVDSQPITATRWVYRICLKSESFRLNRENPSRRTVQ